MLLATMALGASAATLQPGEALARFMLSGKHKLPAATVYNPQLQFTSHDTDGEPALYVFSLSADDGYVVLSADDATVPMLGYSDHDSFDPDNLPPSLRYWMNAYTRQIGQLRHDTINGGSYTGVELPSSWTPIEPLVSTLWSQTEPYNDSCPLYRGERSVTGCVATAMAQVMSHFKYPEVGRDSIKYRAQSIKSNLKFNFEEHPFDWENMLDDYIPGYYNEREAAAVAELMVACGMSVKMDYSPEMSGAYSQNIANALVRYFNYDEGATYVSRDSYSYTEWATMIYDNLKNVGPVIYDGQAPLQGGHSFVCDGYDGNGYFHFNWGWAGLSDGYFLLDALAPEAIGTGGYFGGFSLFQDAILGIQPPTGQPSKTFPKRATQYGILFGEIIDDTLYFGAKDGEINGWGYFGDETAYLDFGVIIENKDNPSEPLSYLKSANYYELEIEAGHYVPSDISDLESAPQFSLADLEYLSTGQKYKLTFASKDIEWEEAGNKAEWMPMIVDYGFPNYVYLTKDEDGSFYVENLPVAMFSLSNIVVPENATYNKPLPIRVDITNPTDSELSRNICAALVNEKTMSAFVSDSFLITLAPGQTITYRWDADLSQLMGGKPKNGAVYEFGFMDMGSFMDYETEQIFITMNYEDTGVGSVITDYDGLSISYDRASGNLITKSAFPLTKISAVAVNGTEITLPADRQTHNLRGFAPGLWIINATDSNGNSKTHKIII